MMPGRLHLVSVGPGSIELVPPMAQAALQVSDLIVGYDLYLKWIAPWIKGKEIKTLPLTKEKERAILAIEAARAGRRVGLVSSGDIGIYAMAGLVFELMSEEDRFDCEVIPGISAAQSCAALLGAPLTHDYATLSLSDLLCPREWIEERARHLAAADLVVALYNVQSQTRQEGVYRILRLFLEHKSPETRCGVVRNAFREEQSVEVCKLGELLERRFDMVSTVIIGNRFTRQKRHFLFTPRGYGGWENNVNEAISDKLPKQAIWVFSGTHDGNKLAKELEKRGHSVIVSTASEYGREAIHEAGVDLPVRAGRIGREARRAELLAARARMIVDATHPFADKMSRQLIELAAELKILYLRYERPRVALPPEAMACGSMFDAARAAIEHGHNIFLATGSKDLDVFLGAPGAIHRSWFVRITPAIDSLEQALKLGVPRSRICCMQGPFTREFNQALWRAWAIDCVVTKESGEAGGFQAKVEAAQNLNIPLIVVTRPPVDYPVMAENLESVIQFCEETPVAPAKNKQPQPALHLS
jgi:precorrin-3B C17-methyltransferase